MPRATNCQEKNEPAKESEEKLGRAGAHLSLRGPRIQRRTRGDEERLARVGDMRTTEERLPMAWRDGQRSVPMARRCIAGEVFGCDWRREGEGRSTSESVAAQRHGPGGVRSWRGAEEVGAGVRQCGGRSAVGRRPERSELDLGRRRRAGERGGAA